MSRLVTVIVPVYQVEQYLDQCVERLIAQSHAELDIILVDDGSQDASGTLCDRWVARDERVRVVHQSNGGLSSARNVGLDLAQGAFITFVDSDDVVAADLIERTLDLALSTDADIVTIGLVPFTDGDPVFTRTDGFAMRSADEELLRISKSGIGWEACGKLYRSDLFHESLRFAEGILYEDLEFAPRVFGAAHRVAVSDSRLYGYRQRADSIMGRSRTAVSPDLIEVLSSNLNFARERYGTGTRLYGQHQTASVLHASKQLERMDSLMAWRQGRSYRVQYAAFVKTNWRGVRGSGELSKLYLVMLWLSGRSPTAFILLFGIGRSLKRGLAPQLRRRSAAPREVQVRSILTAENPLSSADEPTAEARLVAAVVTYHRPEELAAMLSALTRQTMAVSELVVVDNGSDQASRSLALEAGATYIDPGENLGPAGGIARAMKHVLANANDNDWLVLLDDDDPPEADDILEHLWQFAQTQWALDSRTAAVGELGGRYDSRLGIFRRVEDQEILGAVPVDVIGGGHLPMYRCGTLRQVGVFDESLFFGFEEGEFGLRLRQAGYSLYADSQTWLSWRTATGELGRASRSVRTPLQKAAWRRYYGVRNATLIAWRYGGLGTPLLVALGGAVKGVYALARTRRPPAEVLLPVRGALDGLLRRGGRTINPSRSVK